MRTKRLTDPADKARIAELEARVDELVEILAATTTWGWDATTRNMMTDLRATPLCGEP